MRILPKSTGDRYTNTRVRVMKSKLLKRDDYERLLKMSVDGIARFLQETDYKKEIDKLGLKLSGANLIEYALSENLANTFHRIYGYSISSSKQHIANYLKKWDVWNIKTILRGKRSNTPKDEIMTSVIAAGTFSKAFLKEVVEKTTSHEDAIDAFKNTEYYPLLKEHSQNPTELEDSLDQYYYNFALENFPEELQEFVKTQITIINMLNEQRAKKAEIKLKLLEGGLEGGIKLKNKDASPDEANIELHQKIINSASKMVHEFSRSIRPVIGYFIIKENEVRNLRLLVRGKHVGLPQDLIENNLVV